MLLHCWILHNAVYKFLKIKLTDIILFREKHIIIFFNTSYCKYKFIPTKYTFGYVQYFPFLRSLNSSSSNFPSAIIIKQGDFKVLLHLMYVSLYLPNKSIKDHYQKLRGTGCKEVLFVVLQTTHRPKEKDCYQ